MSGHSEAKCPIVAEAYILLAHLSLFWSLLMSSSAVITIHNNDLSLDPLATPCLFYSIVFEIHG